MAKKRGRPRKKPTKLAAADITVGVRITDEIAQWIKWQCKHNRWTKSTLARHAFETLMALDRQGLEVRVTGGSNIWAEREAEHELRMEDPEYSKAYEDEQRAAAVRDEFHD